MATERLIKQPLPPLYLRDLTKEQHQKNDFLTAWHSFYELAKNPEKKLLTDIFPEGRPIPREEIEIYQPEPSWFADPTRIDGVHGIPHLTRVPLYALALAQAEGLNERQTTVVGIASSMHDIQRVDDRQDPNHGFRGAQWVWNHVEEFTQHYAQKGISLGSEDIAEIMVLTTFHEVPYTDIPAKIEREFKSTLQVMRDADGLDRFRTSKEEWWPKEEFFSLTSGKALIPFAKYFTLKSELDRFTRHTDPSLEQTVATIFETAEDIGLVIPSLQEDTESNTMGRRTFAQ